MKKSKAIVLFGRANTGKTTTLNLLIDKLTSKYGATTLMSIPSANANNDKAIAVKYNGLNIAIITEGDHANALDYYFGKIIECDIYICASRTKSSSVEYISNRFLGNYIMWQEKWSISEQNLTSPVLKTLQDEANDLQAEALIKAINSI